MTTATVERFDVVHVPAGTGGERPFIPPTLIAKPILQFNKLVQRIAKKRGTEAAVHWVQSVLGYQAAVDDVALRNAIASGNLDAIWAALNAQHLASITQRAMTRSIHAAIVDAGNGAADILNASGITATFNAARPDIALAARDIMAQLVVGIPHQTKAMIADVVAMAAERGLTTAQQARAIREMVGLPPNWARAPMRLADEIRIASDPTVSAVRRRRALARAVDRRLSGPLKQQIRSRVAAGTADAAFIADVQSKYTASLINRRAMNIARTETLRAANIGLHKSWEQAIEQGALPSTVRRVWLVTPDDRLSPEHARIPGMNSGGRGMREPFDTPEGRFMYPPIRPNCRCGVGLLIRKQDRDQFLRTRPSAPRGRGPRRRRPPTAEEPPELLVEFGSGVSEDFRATVNATLDDLPLGARRAVASRGVKVSTGRLMSEIRPDLAGVTPRGWPSGKTWDMAEGSFNAGRRQITATEFKISSYSGEQIASDRIPGVVRHEFGHAVDRYGKTRGAFSNADEFKTAYNNDVAKIKAVSKELTDAGLPVLTPAEELSYYLQTGVAGRQEAFAEGFAVLYGGGAGMAGNVKMFNEHFSETLAVIRKQVRSTTVARGSGRVAATPTPSLAVPTIGPTPYANRSLFTAVTPIDELALAEREIAAIRGYTSSEYKAINAHLRKRAAASAQIKSDIAAIDSAMARSQFTDNTLVYRAGRLDANLLREGATFTDNGFVSTSISQRGGLEFVSPRHDVLFTIQVPRGTAGIGIRRELAIKASEREIVLDRGLQYRVSRVYRPRRLPNGQTYREVVLEVVPPAPELAPVLPPSGLPEIPELARSLYRVPGPSGLLPEGDDLIRLGQTYRKWGRELRAAARTDPASRELLSVVREFTSEGRGAARRVRGELESVLNGTFAGTDERRTALLRFLRAVDEAPEYRRTIFRGAQMTPERLATRYRVGETLEFLPRSFSESMYVADTYASVARKPGNVGVVFQVENARGMAVQPITAATTFREWEVISSGKFRVLSVERATSGPLRGRTIVKLEQTESILGQTLPVPPAERNVVEILRRRPFDATPSEARAITAYVNDAAPMNKYLRGTSTHVPRYAEPLMRAMRAAPRLTDEITVWRVGRFPEGVGVGHVFTDNGIVSTATSRTATNQYMKAGRRVLEIRVPRGNKALFLENYGSDTEVLLPSGSRFRVTDIKPDRIVVEALP